MVQIGNSYRLNFTKIGSWDDIVETSKEIECLLKSAEEDKAREDIPERQLERLAQEWKNWRPSEGEKFSREMREKTAKQSCIGKIEPVESKTEKGKENRNTRDNPKRDSENAKKRGVIDITHRITPIGKVLTKKIVDKVQCIEENVYKLMLKTNSLYFDHSALHATLSKNQRDNASKRYQMTIHSNNPHIRGLLAEGIQWNGH
ncbi:MAG: DUF5828 family protein [Thermoproteota archaeon]